jgi:hypothetical protein
LVSPRVSIGQPLHSTLLSGRAAKLIFSTLARY